MLRVSLRSTNRDYEIDHWFTRVSSMNDAKKRAETHAANRGYKLVWKTTEGAVVALLDRYLGYYIEDYHDSTTLPQPTNTPRPATVT